MTLESDIKSLLADQATAVDDSATAPPPIDELLARPAVESSRSPRRARWLIAAAVVVGTALTVGAVTAVQRDGKDLTITAGPDTTAAQAVDDLDVTPDVQWETATLSADGLTLTFHVGSRPAGSGPCEQTIEHDVVESNDQVVVAFEDTTPPPEDGEGVGCDLTLSNQTVEVDLSAPLGDRPVLDGIRQDPRTVFREADLVEVTYVPEGFGPSDASPGDEHEDVTWWQQTFQPQGSDWYFAVNQTAEGDGDTLDGSISPVMVNGIEGERITGQMNNTMETIRFQLGDLTIRVWGEMQGPPTFTHSDELLRIAEGIRLPEP